MTRAAAKSDMAEPVSVVLSQALLQLFPDAVMRLTVEARSVNEMITALDARWPGMGDRLRDTSPAVRKHINVFCDGRRLALDTTLEPGSQVFVLTAVSGG